MGTRPESKKQEPVPSGDSEAPAGGETLQLKLYLKHPRPRRRSGSKQELADLEQRVSRAELAAQREREHGAPIEQVRRFAEQHMMIVVEADAARGCVVLRAAKAQAARAFGVGPESVWHEAGEYHRPSRSPRLPPALRPYVEAVVGLDTRPQRPRPRPMNVSGIAGGLLPNAIARLYGMSTNGQGRRQCIALIAQGGGYDRAELSTAFRAMNLPVPDIVDVDVDSVGNAFGQDADADKEVALDIQVAGAVAPQARIAVYFTKPGSAGLVAAVKQAIHDENNRPSVLAITWSDAESNWEEATRKVLDGALYDAAKLGVTVVAAAGDYLATGGQGDGLAHVDYPASHPYVLGCGGTRMTLDDAGTSIVREVVWNEQIRGTGGGISDVFPVPDYQTGIALPPSINGDRKGRGVPDVAAAAAEANGYRIFVHDSNVVVGGTSAVAPLWGAFIALVNEQRGHPLGFINPALYQKPSLLRPVKTGNNKLIGTNIGYVAGDGWSACTGLGTPDGATIVAALTALPVA